MLEANRMKPGNMISPAELTAGQDGGALKWRKSKTRHMGMIYHIENSDHIKTEFLDKLSWNKVLCLATVLVNPKYVTNTESFAPV
jgi:hypothetical protein